MAGRPAPRQQGFTPPRTQMQQQRQAPQRQSGGFGAYNPGQAQPKQTPSMGTPYGAGASSGGGIGTLGGAQSDPRWSHNGGAWNSGQQPKAQAGGVAFPQGYTYRPPQRGQQPSTMPPPGSNRPPAGIAPIIDGPGSLAPPGYGQTPSQIPEWNREGWRPDPNGPATGGGFMLPPELGGKQDTGHPDFVDARQPGMAYMAVMESWYNPQTGERAGFTAGIEPRPGSGWVREGAKPSGDAYGPGPINNAAPPFRSEMFDQYGNPTTPEQFYPQQQAMVGRMYDQFKKMDTGTYLGQGAPPPSWGQVKPLDIQSLWNQAGKDVQAGWQNPFMPGAAQPIQPPSQGSPYNPMQQRPGIGFDDWKRAGQPGMPMGSTLDLRYTADAAGNPISGSSTELGAYRDWLRQQGGAGRPWQPDAPAAGNNAWNTQLTREEFDRRKKRNSRDRDFRVDPYDTYEQYLQSGNWYGQPVPF